MVFLLELTLHKLNLFGPPDPFDLLLLLGFSVSLSLTPLDLFRVAMNDPLSRLKNLHKRLDDHVLVLLWHLG